MRVEGSWTRFATKLRGDVMRSLEGRHGGRRRTRRGDAAKAFPPKLDLTLGYRMLDMVLDGIDAVEVWFLPSL